MSYLKARDGVPRRLISVSVLLALRRFGEVRCSFVYRS